MINDHDFKDFHYTVLGAKSRLIGDLELYGDTIVNSYVEGSIKVLGQGKLVLERGCFIKGKIQASDIEIFGTVEGEIECSGLISIRSSAYVQGKITSARLVIYPGAIVEMQASSQDSI